MARGVNGAIATTGIGGNDAATGVGSANDLSTARTGAAAWRATAAGAAGAAGLGTEISVRPGAAALPGASLDTLSQRPSPLSVSRNTMTTSSRQDADNTSTGTRCRQGLRGTSASGIQVRTLAIASPASNSTSGCSSCRVLS